ncbi:MAG TPA: TonB-dependent receptor [Steroidobacteraceae bacterium]|jgi:iron complex outermembrane receptor protein
MASRSRSSALASFFIGCASMLGRAAGTDSLEPVIVTGTRALDHTQASSAVPIAVYDAQRLEASGFTDVGRALEAIAPAVNMPHSQTSPSAANTRSITLKGMAPDQVLVLVNGKRWQPSAVLVFNNAVGRGSAPYDLGAIPLNAVERIEVLADGAAAQYGSDAIAGVVNIILKSNAGGGLYAAQSSITDAGDGFAYDLTGSQGFRLGGAGHLTLSGDVRHQDITNRAGPDPRNGNQIDQQVGDPRALDLSFAADAGYQLALGFDAYGSLIVSRRDSNSAPTFRLPGTSVIYPKGFLPRVEPLIWSTTAISGVRGELGAGISADLSNSFGYNSARFDVHDTANNALGAASPTDFDSGTLKYWQDTVNLTLRRNLADIVVPGTLAAGAEYRSEHYSITPGDPASFNSGGAQGFPGFSPRIPVDNARKAVSAFVDAEAKPQRWLTLGAAGRFDHYDDFGAATTWKATLRTDPTDWLGFRGSLGTAFRAPSLQQEYFSSVVSQISPTGAILRTGTYQVRDPIAAALGATPLKPEKSRDYSFGTVLHPSNNFRISADWYDIDVKDRIVLGDQLKGAAVTSILLANGVTDVQQVQFFTNAAHTRTRGYEISAAYSADLGGNNLLETILQYGQYHTRLVSLATNPQLPSLPLLGATSTGLLLSAQPADKLTSTLTFTHDRLSATVNVDRYGHWVSAPLGVAQTFGAKTLVDFIGRVGLTKNISLSAGVLNIGNVFPDRVNGGGAIGLPYGDEAPFGVNGRFYSLRAQIAH